MLYRFFYTIFITAVLFAGGCSEQSAPEPPLARAELTARLNAALEAGRDSEALAITDKLAALDPDDADIIEMRERIVCNICTRTVQGYINQGNLSKARKYLRGERRKYPALLRLQMLENDLENLYSLQKAADALAAAKTIPDLTAALEKITPMAAKYPQAKQLHADIKKRRSELAAMRRRAEAQTESAVKNGQKL